MQSLLHRMYLSCAQLNWSHLSSAATLLLGNPQTGLSTPPPPPPTMLTCCGVRLKVRPRMSVGTRLMLPGEHATMPQRVKHGKKFVSRVLLEKQRGKDRQCRACTRLHKASELY